MDQIVSQIVKKIGRSLTPRNVTRILYTMMVMCSLFVCLNIYQKKTAQGVPENVSSFWRENLDWRHLKKNEDSFCNPVPFPWRDCTVSIAHRKYNKNGNHGTVGLFQRNKNKAVEIFNWTSEFAVHVVTATSDCSFKSYIKFSTIKDAAERLSDMDNGVVFGIVNGYEELQQSWKNYHWFSIENTTHFFTVLPSSRSTTAETMRRPYRLQSLHYRTIHIGHRYPINFQPDERSFEMKGPNWEPPDCISRWNVGLIIPYRNREEHLEIFFQNIIPYLQQQLLKFTIIVVEQTNGTSFNRAALMNIGFLEGLKLSNFDCYIFHDVDLIPEDLANHYACTEKIRNLVTGRNHRQYAQYGGYLGGATIFRAEHLRKINGFSNKFYGWGGEDDNAHFRVTEEGMRLVTVPWEIGRYSMLPHEDHRKHVNRKIWTDEVKPAEDGIHSVQYEVKSITKKSHYIRILVDLPPESTDST